MLSSIPSSQRLSNGEAAFEKLDRESRLASWLIFAVAALISTHELPMSILNIYNLAKYNQGTLPVVLYGCWASVFVLWQSTIYPLAFFIYAIMSGNFRSAMWQMLTLRCLCSARDDVGLNIQTVARQVLVSPCSVRKSRSKGISQEKEETCNLSAENQV